MAGHGKKVNFHGSFADKSLAMQKEKEVKGSYIREVDVPGHGTRFLVLTRVKKK